MADRQDFVLALGLSLVAVNALMSGLFDTIWQTVKGHPAQKSGSNSGGGLLSGIPTGPLTGIPFSPVGTAPTNPAPGGTVQT